MLEFKLGGFWGIKNAWILDEVHETALNSNCIPFIINYYQTEQLAFYLHLVLKYFRRLP